MASSIVQVMCVILVLCCARSSLAKVYMVGDSDGWRPLRDYYSWADKKFFSGDILVFRYAKGHTAAEVDQMGFITCNATNAIISDDSGKTSITLKSTGWHYFISATHGDCDSGMEFPVKVL